MPPLLFSAPATFRLDPPTPKVASSSTGAAIVGERAGRRHRNLAFEVDVAPVVPPVPIEASPASALFDPSAVLSSMKAWFPYRWSPAPLARLVICPLPNSIALCRSRPAERVAQRNDAGQDSRLPNPAAPVTSRSAWLVLEPVNIDRAPAAIAERRRRHRGFRGKRGVAEVENGAGEAGAVGQRPANVEARSALARIIRRRTDHRCCSGKW